MVAKFDQAERKMKGESLGLAKAAGPHALAPAGTRFNHFAERVLPTLRQLRAARKIAEALIEEATVPGLLRIGGHALEAIRSIDAMLRSTGVYELSELAALENDATRMSAVCRVLDEVGERLRALAEDIAQQAADAGSPAALVSMLAVLRAPQTFGPDGPDAL